MFTHSDFKIFSYTRSLIYQELMSYVRQSFVLFLINEKFHLCNLLSCSSLLYSLDYYNIITIFPCCTIHSYNLFYSWKLYFLIPITSFPIDLPPPLCQPLIVLCVYQSVFVLFVHLFYFLDSTYK